MPTPVPRTVVIVILTVSLEDSVVNISLVSTRSASSMDKAVCCTFFKPVAIARPQLPAIGLS
jgi:hypothetical protein